MSDPAPLAFFPQAVGTEPRLARLSGPPIFLPKEHGSWSLALEPLALGLLIAPSSAGAALAAASLAGFLRADP